MYFTFFGNSTSSIAEASLALPWTIVGLRAPAVVPSGAFPCDIATYQLLIGMW